MTPELEAWGAVQFALAVGIAALLWLLLVEQWEEIKVRQRHRRVRVELDRALTMTERKRGAWAPTPGDGIVPPKVKMNGLRIIESLYLTDTPFVLSKNVTVQVPSRQVIQIGDRLVMHPQTARRLKSELDKGIVPPRPR